MLLYKDRIQPFLYMSDMLSTSGFSCFITVRFTFTSIIYKYYIQVLCIMHYVLCIMYSKFKGFLESKQKEVAENETKNHYLYKAAILLDRPPIPEAMVLISTCLMASSSLPSFSWFATDVLLVSSM